MLPREKNKPQSTLLVIHIFVYIFTINNNNNILSYNLKKKINTESNSLTEFSVEEFCKCTFGPGRPGIPMLERPGSPFSPFSPGNPAGPGCPGRPAIPWLPLIPGGPVQR